MSEALIFCLIYLAALVLFGATGFYVAVVIMVITITSALYFYGPSMIGPMSELAWSTSNNYVLIAMPLIGLWLQYARPYLTEPTRVVVLFHLSFNILVGLIWITLYAHLVARAHRTLTRGDVRRWLEGATGVVLIALGLRVAVEPR